jgi:hypothetical protein
MLITNFLKYKHWSPCWVYIIPILGQMVSLVDSKGCKGISMAWLLEY